MHKMRHVDAVCKIPPWAGNGCKKYHRLLPSLWPENDRNAYVRQLRIWERRMER